jgi:hypothetical protein
MKKAFAVRFLFGARQSYLFGVRFCIAHDKVSASQNKFFSL